MIFVYLYKTKSGSILHIVHQCIFLAESLFTTPNRLKFHLFWLLFLYFSCFILLLKLFMGVQRPLLGRLSSEFVSPQLIVRSILNLEDICLFFHFTCLHQGWEECCLFFYGSDECVLTLALSPFPCFMDDLSSASKVALVRFYGQDSIYHPATFKWTELHLTDITLSAHCIWIQGVEGAVVG